MKKIILLLFAIWQVGAYAQETFPVNGVEDERPMIHAFTNATIFLDHKTKIENATLVIEKGVIKSVGTNVSIPAGAQVHDLKNKFVYPSFIDVYTNYGLPKVKASRASFLDPPQFLSKKDGAFGWNEAIKSEYDAISEFKVDDKTAKTMRSAGFGAVLSFKPDGIVRGTSVFVTLANKPEQNVVINDRASANLSFNKGTSKQNYPNSIMGAVALLRQTHYDAEWYASEANDKQNNQSLKAYNDLRNLPQIFEVRNKLRLLLADKVGDETGVQYIIKGAGDEYQRLQDIKATNAALILPLNFPDAYDVSDPYESMDISLDQMKHWEMAPANAGMVASQNITFTFTSAGLKKRSSFLQHIRKAIAYGLSEEKALEAITATPARLLKVSDMVGSLQSGKMANFIITSGNVFSSDVVIYENWIQGSRYQVNDMYAKDYAGKYHLSIGNTQYNLEISGKPGKHKLQVKVNDSTTLKVKSSVEGEKLTMSFEPKKGEGLVRLSGWIASGQMKGQGQLANGSWVDWNAKRTGDIEGKSSESKTQSPTKPELGNMIYPFKAYGWEQKPQQETILFRNATVWTGEDDGVLENTDVLLRGGKIVQIGKNISASGAKVINASGKHLTAGIIDEHSHIALSGVNEGSQSITAEVRMYDAVDSEDVNIYRQLAGGVTAAQLLHGSANPVGGQSALVKFRWGSNPEEMKIAGADGYIKFALGENVKQSNWGDRQVVRFPQTRMGVEQVFMDAFTRATAYDEEWRQYQKAINSRSRRSKTPAPIKPRRDLELETLAEIMNKERFITCHSYVQSEINMLMKVAEHFDFNVNTFTHILEGYKVADKMAKHGASGSTFADWWAYKYEVREAIPYNPELMRMAGVNVAINSDDAEMARRLNQEAAKSVKYGGMSEHEAWKMVTINPAKMLHLENRMGSIKVGKDADIVLWTDNPLSIYAKAEKTLIDGIIYYDIEEDKQRREAITAERARLINKMAEAKKGGAATQKSQPAGQHHWHCEDLIIGNDY
ncbi:MAG: amidohydrolase family protein [Bacteroidota bacterium]